MMIDYADLVEAVDRLTLAVNQQRNSFGTEFLSMALATVGSVFAVLIFEWIKNRWIAPREEFRKLQRRVNSTLSMYACYYANPAKLNKDTTNERMIENYSEASKEVRKMAVEVIAFADERKRRKCCGISVENIRKAGNSLTGLSNSFFYVGDYPELENGVTQAANIRCFLGIGKEK